jgi:PTS system fructose-specific IIC component
MGGPINKVAFTLGVSMIGTNPEVMGAVGAAGAVAPIGCMFGVIFAKYLLKVKVIDEEDTANAVSAGIMGTIGISEGAIPFAIKYPK